MSILSKTMPQGRKAVAGLLAAILLVGGCSNQQGPGVKEAAVRIGVLYPFSGPDKVTGDDLRNGLELALDIINEDYDLPLPLAKGRGLPGQQGRAIELVLRDTQSDPVHASKGLEELVSREKVHAVMGCYHSSVTALASEQAEMLRIPFLNAESTSPILVQRGLRWFFRITPDDRVFSENFFEFLNAMRERNLLSRSCPLALVYEDGLWGTNVAQAQQRLAWHHDYRIAADVPYRAAEQDYQQELDVLRRAMPAVVLQASYARDALAFVRGYRAWPVQPLAILGMNAGFVSPEFIPSLGGDAEHVLSREVWAVDLSEKKPVIKMVNDRFRQRYHQDMTGNSARAFTGLMVLAEAINRASELNAEAVREALLGTDLAADQLIMPWDGIRFDPATGQNILGKGIIVQVQQGRYVTVWPDFLAVSPPVWTAADCVEEK